MSDSSDNMELPDGTSAVPGFPSGPVDDDDAVGSAQLDTDFARYFLALPEAPPGEDLVAEQTFEDLVEEAETIPGADRIAARARMQDPGPATALMLDAISRRRLTATGLLDAACAAERLASWTQAVQHRYLAAFARPEVCASTESLTEYASSPGQPLHEKSASPSSPGSGASNCSVASDADDDLSRSGAQVHGDPAISGALGLAAFKVAAAEVAAALRVSPISANRRVSQAVDFTDELPATLTALQRGVIDRGRSLVIADRTQNLPPDLRSRVEDVVVPKAASRNAGQLRGIVDRAVIAADPAAAKKRQEVARRNRSVSLRAGEDGMSVFRADLPADKACTAFTVIDQIALINSRHAAEKRTINALRADAFADIFDQLADHGSVHLHTILGKGHTNVDPRRPCPNHTDSAGPAPADIHYGAGVSTTPSDADSHVPAETNSAGSGAGTGPDTDRSGVVTTAVAKPDTAAENNTANSRSSTPADKSVTDFGTASWACAAGAIDYSVDDQNQLDRTDDTIQLGRTDDTIQLGRTDDTIQLHDTADTNHVHDTDDTISDDPDTISDDPDTISDDPDDEGIDRRIEDLRRGGRQQLDEALAARTGRPLEPKVLVTHGAGNLPAAANTSCGCYEMSTPAAARPVWGLGTHQGRATGLNVTIAATTLAGLDDLPGELDGHGTIPADLARALAASAATITAIAVNPSCGKALDHGRTAYRPRQAQRDYVNQRDQTCRFPSCRQPAWRCQLDHSDEFCPGKQDSGVTCPCNLACLCKFHHDLKTFGLWDTEHHVDDSITFTSPIGRTYTTHTREWLTGMTDSQTAETIPATASGTDSSAGYGSEKSTDDNDDPPF